MRGGNDKRRATVSLTDRFPGGLYTPADTGLKLLPPSYDTTIENLRAFDAFTSTADYGAIRISRVTSRTLIAPGRELHPGDENTPHTILVYVRAGALHVEHHHGSRIITPGQVQIVDCSAIFRSSSPNGVDCRFVHIPTPFLTSRSLDPRKLAERPLSSSPLHTALGDLLDQLLGTTPNSYGKSAEEHLERTVLDLSLAVIHHSLDAPASDSVPDANMRARVRDYIDHNFTDPTLDVARIARRIGASTRYLHRLFENEESSLYQYILYRRVEYGVRLLTAPTTPSRSITEVASRSGFAGPAQFRRAVKARFGLSPRELKDQSFYELIGSLSEPLTR